MDVTMNCPTNGFAHIKIRVYNEANISQYSDLSFYIAAGTTNINKQYFFCC